MELKLIKCPDCGVKHPEGSNHSCDIKVLHGYQCGKRDTLEAVLEKLKWMEDNYRAELAETDCMKDDPFSDGILSAMFCVTRAIQELANDND